MQGTFISFEGVDGVGKTTQVERLRAYVESQGRECVVTREPGGTALGVAIRKMLLHGVDTGDENDCADIAPRTEALLFAADRAQHVAEVILPALQRGAVVITDRYLDSSLAYQAGGRELTAAEIRNLSMWATNGLLPERTYLPAGLRVREALELFCDFYADFSREKAVSMLADLKIQPGDKISAMSKGTREKVQLVLVMSRAAGLYLLDEPIGGVDPAARDYILDTIIRNYSEDAALVLSTHLIGDIEKVLDDVVMIGGGRLVASGSVDELRAAQGKSVDAFFREVFKC